jgi:hypothetical protein
MVAAETMTGLDAHVLQASADRLKGVMRKYNRLAPQ